MGQKNKRQPVLEAVLVIAAAVVVVHEPTSAAIISFIALLIGTLR